MRKIKHQSIIEWSVQIVMILCFISVFVYVFMTRVRWQEPSEFDHTVIVVDSGWRAYTVDSSGTASEMTGVKFPCTIDVKKTDTAVLERSVPAYVSDTDWLALRFKNCNIKIYVEDELRGSYTKVNTSIYRTSQPSRYVYADLDDTDAGKTVRLEMTVLNDGEVKLSQACVGQKIGIFRHYLDNQKWSFLCVVVFSVLGIALVIAGTCIRIGVGNIVHLDYLGWTLAFVALWDMTQSDFRDFLFNNITAISIVPTMSLSLFVIPFALYINDVQKHRYSKLNYIFCSVSLAHFVVMVFMHIFKIVDMYDTIWLVFVINYLYLIILMYTFYRDRKSGCGAYYKIVRIGVYIMAALGIVQIVSFLGLYPDNTGLPMCLGYGIMTIFCFVYEVRVLIQVEMDRKTAHRVADMKSEFLATMSHEIRTPINAILGMNEMILRESGDGKVLGYASDVDSAGTMLLSLINDILDFSKIESGKMEIVPTDYSLSTLLINLYNLMHKRADDKGLELEFNVAHYVPSVLNGDELRVQQILINIITNAIKYTASGSVTVNVSCEEVEGICILKFDVEDTGVGIRKKDIDKLFGSFTRVDYDKNKTIEGTGLGLAITKELLTLMNGSIKVESVYGVGSVFHITIPQVVVDKNPVGTIDFVDTVTSAKQTGIEFESEGSCILIVDDVSLNLKVAAGLLKDTKIDIDVCESGKDCLLMCRKKKYDVILLDHMMPGMDGIETLHRLRDDATCMNRDSVVIMLTANAIQGVKEEYIQEGFNDYLSKPFTRDQMVETLGRYIANTLA